VANVSPKLTIPFTIGTGKIVGQGNQPELWLLYTTDDASNSSPLWVDASTDARAFSTSRGRESELSQFDAGTADVRVGNRDRQYDPNSNALIRPLNRWWLREQFSGETHDLFKGYAEQYANSWPDGGWSNAECDIPLVDEFKILTLDALPTTSPPRGSYSELVQSDGPVGFWEMNEQPEAGIQFATEVVQNAPDPGPSLGLISFTRRTTAQIRRQP